MDRRAWLAAIAFGAASIALTGCSTAFSAVDGTRHLWTLNLNRDETPATPRGFTVRAEEVAGVVRTWRTKESHQLYADRRYYYIVGDFQKLTGANSWIARTRGTRIDGKDRAAFEAWAALNRVEPLKQRRSTSSPEGTAR